MQFTSRILSTIRRVPKGKVATYGDIAAAAGYPAAARAVATALRSSGGNVPWWRILGSGGKICLRGPNALEQRVRLEGEGVRFRGSRVDMKVSQHKFSSKPCLVTDDAAGKGRKQSSI